MLTSETFLASDVLRFTEQIKASEGLRLSAYRCTAGALTIGWGRNVDANPVKGISRVGDSITLEKAESLLLEDIEKAVRDVRSTLPWVYTLNAPRQAVLYDMAFNMGIGRHGVSGLLSFRNTLASIQNGNFTDAASRMLESKWHSQVHGRARKLSRQMATGEWQGAGASVVIPPGIDGDGPGNLESDCKPIFFSKTAIGSAVSMAAGVLALAGYTVSQDEQDSMVELIVGLTVIAGSAFSIFGRIRATKRIG